MSNKKINCRGVEYDDKDMKIAGLQAKITVYIQTLARFAHMGGHYQEIAQEALKRADKAQLNVHPDDLYDPSKLKLN